MTKAINFFQILWAIRDEHIRSYNPPKTVTGRLNENDELTDWTIYSDPVAGHFGIRSGGPV